MALTQFADHFSLDLAQDVLANFYPPTDPFDCGGAWTNGYRIHTLVAGNGIRPTNRRAGRLTLRRAPRGKRSFLLHVDYEKATQGAGVARQQASIECALDALARPLQWELEEQLAPPSQPVSFSLRSKQSGNARKLRFREPFTTTWSLMEAVQRLPPKPQTRLSFTVLDPLDIPKPGHSLEFFKTVEVATRGRPVQLHGFLQHGWGISPQVYWVNEQGRLLVLVSGIDAWILDSGNQSC